LIVQRNSKEVVPQEAVSMNNFYEKEEN